LNRFELNRPDAIDRFLFREKSSKLLGIKEDSNLKHSKTSRAVSEASKQHEFQLISLVFEQEIAKASF
jgi:hypothetical protein